MAKKGKLIALLVFYVFLALLDIGFNALALVIPALGAVAETISELFIEVLSFGIVILLIIMKK